MTKEQRQRLDELVKELEHGQINGKPMSTRQQIDAIFELGLRLGRGKQKPRGTFARPSGHAPGCVCEVCFAPVQKFAKNL